MAHFCIPPDRIGHGDAQRGTNLRRGKAHARRIVPPEYVLIEQSGPDHAPRFVVEARLADRGVARGEAGSKRAAEQEAARRLLARVQEEEAGAGRPGTRGRASRKRKRKT